MQQIREQLQDEEPISRLVTADSIEDRAGARPPLDPSYGFYEDRFKGRGWG